MPPGTLQLEEGAWGRPIRAEGSLLQPRQPLQRPAQAMSHLLPLLLLLLVSAGGCWREEPQKLCAHRFIRALVQVCGGPRWSPPEGRQDSARDDQEILQWLQNRAFRGLAPDGSMDENLDEGLAVGAGEPESPSGIRRAPRWRRANSSPAQHCCINGCTKQDLLAFCPH